MQERLFGPPDAYDAFYEADEDDVAPPFSALDVPLPGGHVWRVAFVGGDDPGIYHILRTDAGDEVPLTAEGLLGWDDVYAQFPILRLAEVAPLARATGLDAATLLFLPAAGIADDAEADAAEALYAVGFEQAGIARGTYARDLASCLRPAPTRAFRVEDLTNDAQEVARDAPLRWWDPGDGWRCNARAGFRRPASAWLPEAFARLDAALVAAGVPMD